MKFEIVHPPTRTKSELCHDFIEEIDILTRKTPVLPSREMGDRINWLRDIKDFFVVELDKMRFEELF